MKHRVINHIKPMLITSGVAGCILTVLGPYGTSNFSLAMRFIYWTGLCMAGGLGAASFDWLNLKFKWTDTPWQLALIQSLGATLSVSTITLSMTFIRYGWQGWPEFLIMPFLIWVISIVICGIGILQRGQKQQTPQQRTRPALFERLKPSLRKSEIYALCAEDHYVKVMTSKGDDLILMRLSDAITEASPLQGLSPHRSWWVAEAGVKTVQKTKGKLSLLLHNDQIAPVSRNAAKSLRQAGWV